MKKTMEGNEEGEKKECQTKEGEGEKWIKGGSGRARDCVQTELGQRAGWGQRERERWEGKMWRFFLDSLFFSVSLLTNNTGLGLSSVEQQKCFPPFCCWTNLDVCKRPSCDHSTSAGRLYRNSVFILKQWCCSRSPFIKAASWPWLQLLAAPSQTSSQVLCCSCRRTRVGLGFGQII